MELVVGSNEEKLQTSFREQTRIGISQLMTAAEKQAQGVDEQVQKAFNEAGAALDAEICDPD